MTFRICSEDRLVERQIVFFTLPVGRCENNWNDRDFVFYDKISFIFSCYFYSVKMLVHFIDGPIQHYAISTKGN